MSERSRHHGALPTLGFPGEPPVTPALVREHKLSSEEYERIVQTLGRAPSYAELGVLSVMWSEHCSYKSSRVHLARLPTTGPRVIQGPGENAGVVDIGDGFAAVFKMESHNHPSYIEPYQGAATGVGGIIRDVFTMGARPIASLDSLRFGRPDHPRTPALLRGVVAGIGGYGNCLGVPTVGGELAFDAAYDGNILVNAFACGVAPADRIFYGRASGVGNPVLYVGAKTGRDGIHGATMASDEFSLDGPSQRPTVQVGDPFMEKLLIEACLEIFAEDLLVGIQDMGAAGLTSSSVEMAGRSGSGLDLDLDRVPRRARGMTPYEMLLSESQERMLLVCEPVRVARVRQICAKWGLDAEDVGVVTDTGRWVVRATPGYDPLDSEPLSRQPVVVCDLPVPLLTEDAPKYQRPLADDAHPAVKAVAKRRALRFNKLAPPASWSDELVRVLGSPNIGSKAWVWRQYDHIVRGGTRVRPGADAAVVRVPCERGGARIDKLLAFAVDAPGRVCELDPFQGGALAVAEACRNLVCAGAEPIGLTDCLNFGSPERPEVMRQFSLAIDGMAAACRALRVPVVGGNVSFYNETDGRAILPTPAVAAVGLLDHAAHLMEPAFPEAELLVVLLGSALGGSLGGSEYLAISTGNGAQGEPPALDLALEARLQQLVLELVRARQEPRVRSLHDVADGGLLVALGECCVLGGPTEPRVGADIDLPGVEPLAEALFGEAPSRIVCSVPPDRFEEIRRRAEAARVPCALLGTTGGDALVVRRRGEAIVRLACSEIEQARARCLESIVGRDALG
jgi:phosphoribosylformylglycinamidine synthase II